MTPPPLFGGLFGVYGNMGSIVFNSNPNNTTCTIQLLTIPKWLSSDCKIFVPISESASSSKELVMNDLSQTVNS